MEIFESKLKAENPKLMKTKEAKYDAHDLFRFMEECRILNVWVYAFAP
jgi:hypothetical protein